MAYPKIGKIDYSYTGFQQAQGNNAFPGTQLDNDLATLGASISGIDEFLRGAFRSDGQLTNGSVTMDALSADVKLDLISGAAVYAAQAQASAEQATDAAEAASDFSSTAASSAGAAAGSAVSAAGSASTATTAAQAASGSATAAGGSATTAGNASASAVLAAGVAEGARDDADGYRQAAQSARDGAVSARDTANTARDTAVAASQDAEDASGVAVAARDAAVTARDQAEEFADQIDPANFYSRTQADDRFVAKTTPIVLLFSGQSNCSFELDDPVEDIPENLFQWNWVPATSSDTFVGNAFVRVTGKISWAIGTALRIARDNPARPVYVLNLSKPGLGSAQWLPGATGGGTVVGGVPQWNMHNVITQNVPAALAVAGVDKLDGVFFWQGETDAFAKTGPYVFRNRYSDIEAYVREYMRWGTPFIMCGLSPHVARMPIYSDTIRKWTMVAPLQRAFVDTRSVPADFYDPDGDFGDVGLHMTASGYNVLGQITYNTYRGFSALSVPYPDFNSIKVRARVTDLNPDIGTILQEGMTVDGITLVEGDLLLVTTYDVAPAFNGIWEVQPTGSVFRDPRLFASEQFHLFSGLLVQVQEGDTSGGSLWQCTAERTGTINSTPITFEQR